MSPVELFRVAGSALVGHRLRSSLTMLSIVIGAFAIVLMTSLAESGLASIRHGIEEVGGGHILIVASKAPEREKARQGLYPEGFTLADGESLSRGLPHVVERTAYHVAGPQDAVSDAGTFARTDLVGSDGRFFDAYRMVLREGRLFSDEDDRRHAPVCVLGATLAAHLFPEGGAAPTFAVGRMVTVGPLRCRVVGVLTEKKRFDFDMGFDWTDLAVVPLEALADVSEGAHRDSTLLYKTDDVANNGVVKGILNARLTARHAGVDDFLLVDFAGMMARFDAIFAMMEGLVGLLSGIALVIGGVGVMNMLLVSVTERVREIGIRKALGARPRDIGAQFLLEATLLSSTGGVVGAALGLAAAHGASALLRGPMPGWQESLSLGAAITASLVSTVLGVAFGWAPARRAARLDPIAAVRAA